MYFVGIDTLVHWLCNVSKKIFNLFQTSASRWDYIASVCVNECGALMKRDRQGKTETLEENPVQVPLGPPQIPN
jgi:hypothetical protein